MAGDVTEDAAMQDADIAVPQDGEANEDAVADVSQDASMSAFPTSSATSGATLLRRNVYTRGAGAAMRFKPQMVRRQGKAE